MALIRKRKRKPSVKTPKRNENRKVNGPNAGLPKRRQEPADCADVGCAEFLTNKPLRARTTAWTTIRM